MYSLIFRGEWGYFRRPDKIFSSASAAVIAGLQTDGKDPLFVIQYLADDGIAVCGIVFAVEVSHIIDCQRHLLIGSAPGAQTGIGRGFRKKKVKNIVAAQQHMVMKGLSQRHRDFFLRYRSVTIHKNGFRGEHVHMQKRRKAVTGNQEVFAQFPGVEGHGKAEVPEEGVPAVEASARSIEKTVVAVEQSFQTAG